MSKYPIAPPKPASRPSKPIRLQSIYPSSLKDEKNPRSAPVRAAREPLMFELKVVCLISDHGSNNNATRQAVAKNTNVVMSNVLRLCRLPTRVDPSLL